MEVGQFISSQKGYPKLMDSSGYVYNKERSITAKISGQIRTYWDCNLRQKLKCKARATTVGVNIVCTKGFHNHTPSDHGMKYKF